MANKGGPDNNIWLWVLGLLGAGAALWFVRNRMDSGIGNQHQQQPQDGGGINHIGNYLNHSYSASSYQPSAPKKPGCGCNKNKTF